MNNFTFKRNKFKVWDGTKMLYPPLMIPQYGNARIAVDDGICVVIPPNVEASAFSLTHLTELQYIGLSDAKKEELYEADIIKYREEYFVILWNQFSCAYNFFAFRDGKLRPEGPIWFSYQQEIRKVSNLLEDIDFFGPFTLYYSYLNRSVHMDRVAC